MGNTLKVFFDLVVFGVKNFQIVWSRSAKDEHLRFWAFVSFWRFKFNGNTIKKNLFRSVKLANSWRIFFNQIKIRFRMIRKALKFFCKIHRNLLWWHRPSKRFPNFFKKPSSTGSEATVATALYVMLEIFCWTN